MFDFAEIGRRRAAARPATKAVIMVASVWYVAALVLVMVAFLATRLGPGLGVHVHPPGALLVLAHVLAALGALLALYVWLYYSGAVKVRSMAIALVFAVISWGLTLGGVACGVPVLSLFASAESGVVGRSTPVTGSASSRRRSLCPYVAVCGHWYAPGGSICYGHMSVSVLVGATLEMEGHGNAWATRVTRIREVRRDLETGATGGSDG